ncbi:IDEAL domain-containing protein [Cytobacillus suaedae]|nr:IDEAL domain-containing protein [Cytobacillus suaedae]
MKTCKRKYVLIKNNEKKYISYNLTEADRFMFEQYAGMVLDELCYRFNLQRLQESINNALDKNDKQLFAEVSLKYNKLLQDNR